MKQIDPTDLFGFLIQDVARLMSRAFEKQPGDLEITRAQARLLAYVALSEGHKQTEIASLMDVQKITLTKMADELEAKGLIERHTDPDDRRVRRLFMAEGAKPVLQDIWKRLSKVSDIALSALPKARRKSFIADMVLVRDQLVRTLNEEHR